MKQFKDGDTIQADIHLDWGITLTDQTIRCSDFDAWECSTKRKTVKVTPDEIVKGNAAKAYVNNLVKDHTFYIIPAKQQRDVYGRILGVIIVSSNKGENVHLLSALMEERQHVRPGK